MGLITWESDAPRRDPAWTSVLDYDGGGLLVYSGKARSQQAGRDGAPASLTVASATRGATTTFTVTAHGLGSGNRVAIASNTLSGWTGLNGNTYIITVVDANSFTIAVNSSGFNAGGFDGAMTTQDPQTSQPQWSIQKLYYDGSSRLIRSTWAYGSQAARYVWDNRASLPYA